MRVITGQAKGQRLKSISGKEVRPTKDRVKEALFNMLGSEIIDIDLLDLYAGSGNLGIEALSRGAKSVTFIEKGSRQVEVIKENLQVTGLEEEAKVIQGDVLTELGRFRPQSFDIILMDPPYEKELIFPTMEEIMERDLLKRAGIISVEHYRKEEIKTDFSNLKLIRERNYGNTGISLYMKSKKGEL